MRPGISLKSSLFSLLALALFMSSAAACSISQAPSPAPPPTRITTPVPDTVTLSPPADTSTTQLAADYLMAVASSDQAGLNRVLGADAWCTTPDSSGAVKKHQAEYGSTQIRNIRVEEMDIKGWAAYPPGSEAARISFEYRAAGSPGWTPASLLVDTVQSPNTQARFICNVTD